MKKDLEFKYFLLNEDTEYLAARIGDILQAIQDIQQNIQGMGTRQLTTNAERIVNQIRRIIHTNWGSNSTDQLEMLQRAGVAIKKGIEEKSDLQDILNGAAGEIQDALADLGVPINSVGSEGGQKAEEFPEQTSPPQGQESQPQPPSTETAPPVAPPTM